MSLPAPRVDPADPVLNTVLSGSDLITSLTDRSQLFLFAYSPVHQALVSWSKNAPKILGVQDSDIAKDRLILMRHVHPDDRLFLMGELNAAIRQNREYVVTYRWVRPDTQEIRMLHCRAARSPRPDDPVFEGIILDISQEFPAALGKPQGIEAVEMLLSNDLTTALEGIAGQASTIAGNPDNIELIKKAAESILQIAKQTTALQQQAREFGTLQEQLSKADASQAVDLNVVAMNAINRVEEIWGSDVKISVAFGEPAPVSGNLDVLVDAVEHVLRDAQTSHLKAGRIELRTGPVNVGQLEVRRLSAGAYGRLSVTYAGATAPDAGAVSPDAGAVSPGAGAVAPEPIKSAGEPMAAPMPVEGASGEAAAPTTALIPQSAVQFPQHVSTRVIDDRMQVHWLALARVMGAVEKFGGAVTVERYAHGDLVLNLYLPLAPESDRAKLRLFLPEPSEPPRVLVIDDDMVVARAMGDFLKAAGMPAVVSDDSGRALNCLKAYHASVDVVIIDTAVRGIDETKLLDMLNRLKPSLQCVLMIDTELSLQSGAVIDPKARERYHALVSAGRVKVLPKPVEREQLCALVKGIMPAA